MNLTVTRPAPYRVFRSARGSAVTILQVRDPETGQAVEPGDLVAYAVVKVMDSPWCEVIIKLRSRLLLTPKTARFLLAAGTIEAIEEPPLIPWRRNTISRTGTEEPGGPTDPAPITARKARIEARPRIGDK
jgi:hypothetical protein